MDLLKILSYYRQEALSNRDLGDKFESLIRSYLRTDPIYADQFVDVWFWSDWPIHWGQDTGIDLVAKERLTGNYCAIQCKFYDHSYALQKSDIDSFFTASGKTFQTSNGLESFTSRIIVSTTDKWSKHAEDALANQTIPVIRLRVQDLVNSPIDWSQFAPDQPGDLSLLPKKQPRPHQVEAVGKVLEGFKAHDRGKLIMACGTGKTFTALKIAETMAGDNGIALFLVPSISLVSQTLREWTAESETPFHAFAVCSDTKVGRHAEDISVHDLAIPATTDSRRLAAAVKGCQGDRPMTVVFSTYQSISVVAQAQREGLPELDVIICDEAHRTTGIIVADKEESHFVQVHNQDFIQGKKRLYMTATPRIYADSAKSKAEENEAVLCSMDDESLYGPVFHRLGFGDAVGRGLLADYKVLVLAVDEKHISRALQKSLADENREINIDDAVKIVGCWNGLAKRMVYDVNETSWEDDPAPMRRAVAFSRSIKDSNLIATMFQQVMDEYMQHHDNEGHLRCEVHHVDGSFNVLRRNEQLDWLKENAGENVCRILSNARCLSEGVDVPALDAVLFLNPRDSVVDVVQSVGRVMRTAPGKKYGYVILPIGIPAGVPPEEALKDNKKYRVVWQVLQALRAHDDRFNSTVNKIELNKKRPGQIQVIGVGGGQKDGEDKPVITQLSIHIPELEEWKDAIYAKIVQKCGERKYWEQWARDVARIAEHHTARIKALLETSDEARQAFDRFLSGLHENINPSIGEDEAIEMLSQHLITRPVFDALFENYAFTKHNPVSVALQEVLDVLEAQALGKEAESLQGFYESVGKRVEDIDNAEGRQKVVIELYDKFFKLAFPKMSERLGIVYTPVEIVDFIIHSAEEALRKHFGVGLTDENVHILDPFVGTGTFIVRLLQSGLIRPEDLERKYQKELHANEIVLLAYYIAAINIEETYHGITGKQYEPFNGIVLTDTFQMAEGNKFTDVMFPENNQRAKRQKEQDIRVIIGNPPYSVGQDNANDNNPNLKYDSLDASIQDTYAKYSSATNKNSLYNSYIRAFRWASNRIKDQGVICFVTSAGWIDGNTMDGFRKILAEEFTGIYVFNLRGNQRTTSGELSRKEGGKIFGSGSRTPIAITMLVKNPIEAGTCEIHYRDIGDYLSREDKLEIVRDYGSIENVPWERITPNKHQDWINLRSNDFQNFMAMGAKSGEEEKPLFSMYSRGIATSRDAWVYNFSRLKLEENMRRMIGFYNEQSRICKSVSVNGDISQNVEALVSSDPMRISWSRGLKNDCSRGVIHQFENLAIQCGIFRPFSKEWVYTSRKMNDMVYQMPKLFPAGKNNLAISVTGTGESKDFSCLMVDSIPNLHLMRGCQCFPFYWYDKVEDTQQITLSGPLIPGTPDADGYVRRDAFTDLGLEEFHKHYNDQNIGKEDIFYYVYGLLHSHEYRRKYESSLKKMLPRMPFATDFWGFSRAGRDLAKWHLNYETVEPYPLIEEIKNFSLDSKSLYRVEKMAFAKSGKDADKSTIIYNSRVKLTGIPAEAYDYVVNGKSAIEWVMERYAVTTDKDSGIKNDPNAWSDDPRYIVDLVKRVVRVSLETVRIVNGLPGF